MDAGESLITDGYPHLSKGAERSLSLFFFFAQLLYTGEYLYNRYLKGGPGVVSNGFSNGLSLIENPRLTFSKKIGWILIPNDKRIHVV